MVGALTLGAAVAVVASATVVQSVEIRPERVEVVVDGSAVSTTRFAAREMTNLLSRVFGWPVPLVAEPKEGVVSIVLGSNAWTQAAGVLPTPAQRDGFVVKVDPSRIYIAGRDDGGKYAMDAYDCGNLMNIGRFEMGTLYGVYHFLERYAGCRFYFIDELGTITPQKSYLSLPVGCERVVPDFVVRNVYMTGDGAWPDGKGKSNPSRPKAAQWLRLRLETERVPCCHGLIYDALPERFAKTHPEYFQLRKDGSRCLTTETNLIKGRQFCHTSGVWNEIYRDAKSYLSGEGPEIRKMQRAWSVKPGDYAWNANAAGGKYFDVMLQDGFDECRCEACQAAYDRSSPNFASELIWSRTAEVASRLKADGVGGYITQMAYNPYNDIPQVDIPDNVLVMVAESGPFSIGNPAKLKREYDHVKGWVGKLHGRKVWLWTYPMKLFSRALKNIPQVCPRAWGRYYQDLSPWIFGAFGESESDRPIFNYLNYYVFSRVGWDNKVDIDSVIDEHHRLMFGAAAPEMKEFYDALERHWVNEIAGVEKMGPLGPVIRAATFPEIWKEIYNEAELARLGGLFASGLRKVPSESLEAKRLRYIKEQIFDPMAADGRAFLDAISVPKALARRQAQGENKSIILNGDFNSLGGWKLQNVGSSTMSLDRQFRVTGSASLKVTCTNDTRIVHLLGKRYKPNTRYRFSFFVRLDDMQKLPGWSGVTGEFYDTVTWFHYPEPALCGSTDWMYQSFEFTSADFKDTPGRQPYFQFLLKNVSGTAWFDGVRLEEIER